MTPDDFRRIALSMPDAVEATHMGHPDFRVGRRIFATIGSPDGAWAMVKLTPEQQALFMETAPAVFVPASGAWGRGGSTNVRLAAADDATLNSAMAMAWRNIAAKSVDGRNRRDLPPVSGEDLDRAFARARAALAAARLPEVEETVSFGTPAMKVRGKFLTRVKDRDTLVFRCPVEQKEFLIAAAPEIYFETKHYKGWPAVLVRLSRIDDAELAHCLERAWRLQAPAKLVARFDGTAAAAEKPKPRRARRTG